MQAQYEEKTFESYFNSELDHRSEIYFPFGQVQEGSIGADAATYSRSRWLWWKLGFPFLFRNSFNGVDLVDVAEVMEKYLSKGVKNIPNIKANVLFQYKRPEVMRTQKSSEWHHWNKKYYRYQIYQEQQDLLSHLHSKFSDRALILYASPAIESMTDLVAAKVNKKIIECTNFCQASKLTGHHRNTYIQAGTFSIACSSPERIQNFNLLETLDTFQGNVKLSNEEILVSFAQGVRSAVNESAFHRSVFQAAISQHLEAGIEAFPMLFSFVSMSIFRELTGSQWIFSIKR